MVNILFWSALTITIYTYIGYPITLALLSNLKKKKVVKDEEFIPFVTLLLSAYNEEKVIAQKIENSLALDYPENKLEIIVVSDGSTDKTEDIVAKYKDKGIILKSQSRAGKTSALNNAIPLAKGEIIVLSDANTMYQKDVIKKLVRYFIDPSIGAVSGDVRLINKDVSYGQGEGLYCKYERYIQKKESLISSLIGVDGAMYSIRKELYKPISNDIILDDLVDCLNIVKQNYRVIYEPEAIGFEETAAGPKGEFKRRVRVAGGGFQMIMKKEGIPSIFQPLILFQFLFHKVFRWLTPFFLIIIFFSNMILLNLTIYKFFFIVQSIFYSFALIGWIFNLKVKLFSIPFYFCLIQLASFIGCYKLLHKTQKVTWEKGR